MSISSLPPRYLFEIKHDLTLSMDRVQFNLMEPGNIDVGTPNRSSPFNGKLIGNERLTAHGHFQDVRLITFDVFASAIRFVHSLLFKQL